MTEKEVKEEDIRIRCPQCGGFLDPEGSEYMCRECFKELKEKAEKWDRFQNPDHTAKINKAKEKLKKISELVKQSPEEYWRFEPNGHRTVKVNPLKEQLEAILHPQPKKGEGKED